MKKTVTVAVCGVQPRTGTTTQALQMVGYLQMMGYSAAYVELAEQGYIEQMRKLYQDVSVKGNCVLYDRLHLYQKIVHVREEEDYDFLVKDYGAMDDERFNQVSYLEQDIHIICGGVKPNEIFEVNKILRQPDYQSARFIFSFVPPEQKESILELMTNRAENTFFANYNPDPFSYDSTMNKNYRLILGDYMTGTAQVPGKARVFKGRMKNGLTMLKMKAKGLKNNHMIHAVMVILYTVFLYILFRLWLP